ncbi:dTDP-4-dehydrorhamnose reductase [Pseudomonas oryzihabitans]|uniref:dTDP-4-dehydrorhamnose reductase n=1 Tax=Pseudomonas oryzihabitans TaxID=47885 RepID=UPI002B1D97DA|nr:dTDP-4-dehydrorhamnose reductase [Pseudomonas oryzihabitans]
MKILVTGANGQVGRCLTDRLQRSELAWEAHGRATLDIADEGSVTSHLQRFAPDVVINAAAYTAVDKAEQEPEIAARGNIEGPAVLAQACGAAGIALLHLSTDYVFDGTATEPYQVEDPVSPSGVYGMTKLEGENRVLSACPRSVVLRTAWVFSEHCNNFLKTMLRLAADRDELRVVRDQVGCPTYAGHIADALLQIAAKVQSQPDQAAYGLYHFGGDSGLSWCDFARYIVDAGEELGMLQRTPLITGIATSEFPTLAKRPAYSMLDSSVLEQQFGIAPSDWRQGVRQTLLALKTEHAQAGSLVS